MTQQPTDRRLAVVEAAADLINDLERGGFVDRHGHPATNLATFRNLEAVAQGRRQPHDLSQVAGAQARARP